MYAALKSAHIALAVITISGFAVRGALRSADSPLLAARFLRTAPHIVDTCLLATGIAMLSIAAVNPLHQPWLLAKFAGVVVYVLLGTLALKRGKTRSLRSVAFWLAVAVFAWIVGTAIAKSPQSWLNLLPG